MTKQEHLAQWLDKAKKAKQVPMSPETTGVFLQVMTASIQHIPLPAEVEQNTMCRIINARAKAYGYTIDPYGLVIMAEVSGGSPGNAVMYTAYLASRGLKVVTPSDIVDVFPFGFWDQETLHSLWDAQKVLYVDYPTDNLLDSLSGEDFLSHEPSSD